MESTGLVHSVVPSKASVIQRCLFFSCYMLFSICVYLVRCYLRYSNLYILTEFGWLVLSREESFQLGL